MSIMNNAKKSGRVRYRVVSALVVFAAVISLISLAGQSLGSSATNLKGWIWNAYTPKGSTDKIGLGWSSLNCLNDFDNDGELENQCDISASPRPYGLNIALGADGTLNGTDDYVQGCVWSSAYGWICFNKSDAQCSTLAGTPPGNPNTAACSDLSSNGVAVRSYSGYFYYLDSPVYSSWGSPTLTSSQRATILSLWSSTDTVKSYIGFPTEPGNLTLASTTNATTEGNKLFGCFGCTTTSGTSGSCKACLNVSTEDEDSSPGPATNPNPNLLAWNCSDCTVTDPDGGSCLLNRDKNSCKASSCTGMTAYTGVVVNEYPASSGQYEMCGWGFNAYSDTGAIKNQYSIIDDSHDDDGLSTDMEPDADGVPAFFFFSHDDATGENSSRIGRCVDPACKTKKSVLVNPLIGYNTEVSHARVSVNPVNNVPTATYGYSDGIDVRIAYCTDASCSAAEEKNVVAPCTAGSYTATYRATSAVGADGFPVISYYTVGGTQCGGVFGNDVKFIKCNDSFCSSHSVAKSLTGSGNGGFYNDIEIMPTTNNPVVVYGSGNHYYIVKCADASCGTVNGPYVVATGPDVTTTYTRLDMEFADASTVYVSYFYTANSSVGPYGYYVQKINLSSCSGPIWSTCTGLPAPKLIATATGAAGDGFNSLAIDRSGFPVVSYLLGSTKTMYIVRCNDAECTTITGPIAIKPTGENIKLETNVIIGTDDFPSASYYDSAGKAFRFVKCNSFDCTTARNRGLGWLAFNPQRVGDVTHVYGEGNIFSGGNITSPVGPAVGKYNSAYIIEASGEIKNWFSSRQYSYDQRGISSPYLKEGAGQPQVYQSIFGKLDYKGIVTDVGTGDEVALNKTGTNKYGGQITRMLPSDREIPDVNSNALNNRVFFWKNPGDSISMNNAQTIICEVGENGAGVVVIDGNLQIDGNISYGSSCSPSKLRDVASLVWIVRGDVTIAPAVTTIAGTFIVLGDGDPDKCPPLSSTDSENCGRFNTGASDSPFTSQGAVLARQFNFQRTYSSSSGPAETFIADGRLQANTPAGLSDLAKSLPRFSGGF